MATRGRALAEEGDCSVCHTADQGAPYAGGRPIKTPFGTVYSTNITPDMNTGLGKWSLADFKKALRDGTAPGGRQLYPAFPYDHFTHLKDQDIADLYTFLMSRNAVEARPPPNRMIVPLGFRPLLLGWKALFLKKTPVADDPSRSAEWNRGRYLSETLGHCGSCHSPRNLLGAEETRREYDGGWSDGWYAPPLNQTSPAAAPWTADALYTYLRTGLSLSHAAAAGPMGPVTQQLAAAPEADVRALAVYFAAQQPQTSAGAVDQAQAAAIAHPLGRTLFAGACAACHDVGAPMMNEGRPALALGTPLREANPQDTLQIILQGLKPPVGRSGPSMPAYAAAFNDAELADLIAYLRERYTKDPPWTGDLEQSASKARAERPS